MVGRGDRKRPEGNERKNRGREKNTERRGPKGVEAPKGKKPIIRE